VNDRDETTTWRAARDDDLSNRLWELEDSAADDDRAVDPTGRFVNLAFIGEALKRRAWLWCATALIGLLIGSGLYVKDPPAYQASTSVLVQDGSNVDLSVTIQTDQTLAMSRTVAAQVVQQLGLRQTITSFRAAYTVTVVTAQVLLITVGAPLSNDAVSRASAVAAAFLQFHADYARTQEQQLVTELDQQVSQAQQHLSSISSQINRVSNQPSSPAQQATLATLKKERDDANSSLVQIEQYATSTLASARTNTNAIVTDSRVLDAAAPIPHSHVKAVALYVAGGLFGGLVAGMAIVIIAALTSARLRRRDDVADALGAPVRLSVGSAGGRRWRPHLPGSASTRRLNLRRVAAYLRAVVPGSSQGPAGLAVVAVDNACAVARAVMALAVSYASQGQRVVLADLSTGAHVARLLRIKNAGLRTVGHGGVELTVMVPDKDDVAPVGPLIGRMTVANPAQPSEALAAASAAADLVLTLTTLDPAFGGDHLATWATDVVVVVTAGQSSGERLHGVGEMIRLAGTRLDSAVLIGADKSDESLGVLRTQDEPAQAGRIDSMPGR
jgi:capsular polysaccharide biosynthesis protein